MSCPNSDPQFDKTMANFYDINSPDYPTNRKYTFYCVCIIVRFILYYLIYLNINKPYVTEIVTFFALVSLFNLYPKMDKPNQQQWWSRKFQFIIALFIALVGGLSLVQPQHKYIIPILLFVSLFGGIFQSTLIDFC